MKCYFCAQEMCGLPQQIYFKDVHIDRCLECPNMEPRIKSSYTAYNTTGDVRASTLYIDLEEERYYIEVFLEQNCINIGHISVEKRANDILMKLPVFHITPHNIIDKLKKYLVLS